MYRIGDIFGVCQNFKYLLGYPDYQIFLGLSGDARSKPTYEEKTLSLKINKTTKHYSPYLHGGNTNFAIFAGDRDGTALAAIERGVRLATGRYGCRQINKPSNSTVSVLI